MNSKKRLSIVMVIVLILSLAAGSVTSFAESNQQKLNRINQEISAARNQLSASQAQVSSLTGQINALDGQISVTTSQIVQTQAQITQTRSDIQVKVQELDAKSAEIVQQNNDLNDRLSAMYKNGEAGYLEVLLGSTSFSELLTNIDMISRIYQQDEEMMQQLQLQYDQLADTKRQLEALEQQLKAQEAQLEAEKASLQASRSQAASLRAQAQQDVAAQNALIDDLNSSAASITALIRAEEAAAKKAAQEKAAKEKAAQEAAATQAQQKAAASQQKATSTAKAASSSSTAKTYTGTTPYTTAASTTPIISGSGTFCLPAPQYTRLSSPFGYRIHPISHVRKLHTGIDFGAPANSPAVAGADGVVIYAGWYNGYGNTVVISHGNGISTLYAHNNSLCVTKGQSVKRGQQIAYIGSTGNSTGPHCHFEVRINGTPVNPAPYL